MNEGELGHLYPVVNNSQCISCNLCRKVCPQNHPIGKVQPTRVFACWNKDIEEYKSSTSGGVSAAFAESILSNGGVVYGCSFQGPGEVSHIRIDNLKDVSLIKGSKYVQSSIHDVFKLLKDDIEVGRTVLFIGTPCQVAGLRSFLGREYSHLFLVDLICHGVPSQSFLFKHIRHKSHHSEYNRIKFRDEIGCYHLQVFDGEKQLYTSNMNSDRFSDAYINAFYDGFSIRPSCHKCQYADSKRCGDVTLGDFWGLPENAVPPHKYGVSCVLSVTDKGYSLFTAVRDQLQVYERSLAEAVNGNDKLREPQNQYPLRTLLFRKFYHYFGYSFTYHLLMFDKITLRRFYRLKFAVIKSLKKWLK